MPAHQLCSQHGHTEGGTRQGGGSLGALKVHPQVVVCGSVCFEVLALTLSVGSQVLCEHVLCQQTEQPVGLVSDVMAVSC